MSAATETRPDATTAVANLIRFLETGDVAEGLFAADVFADVNVPHWRLQSETVADLVAIRNDGRSGPSRVTVRRVDPTDRGFVIEYDETWQHEGQTWYCRELIRADVVGSSIVELVIFCTGDWDERRQNEFAAAVTLPRP